MLKLLQNEWMKLWHKKGTWVMVALLVIITAGTMSLMKWIETQQTDVSKEVGNGSIEVEVDQTEWKASVEGELAGIQAQLADDSLSKTKRSELQGKEKVLEYHLSQSIAPLDDFEREGMIMDPSSIASTVLLLTVIVAAGIVAAEFSQGTIKMLLTRPVKRWKILTSKFITVNLFGILLMLIGYIVYVALAFILFKSGEGQYLVWNGKEVVEGSIWGRSFYIMLLSFGSVFVTTAFAFTIGSVFRSSSLAIGLSLFIYFMGSTVTMLLARYEVAKYILFTHMDLTQYETGYQVVAGISLPFSLAVLAVYVVVFLVISYTTFVQRDVKA
ncbi:ABC transporter permease [Sporosarcina sp. Te-1]|uniref:ABC transporter permease n=1 Tax=Sporosarcina sp. Te-1 TaxID=2818390 RepID=UPI001A9FC73E|nr:ABC transporter permease [Sporosarcina sp. Te-1]QTD39972.1 ABC transporter permease [Sporosarcina sp. Te-1]